MQKLFFPKLTSYKDLPFDRFNNLRFSVYAIDLNWNYLFVNKFAKENLGERGIALEGKNMWTAFPEFEKDINYLTLKSNSENGRDTNIIAISPVTAQRLHITGQKLQDCYLFTSSITPKKEELLEELKTALKNRKL